MARYPAPNPEHVEYAGEETAKGRSTREIARDFAAAGVKVSNVTVSKWAKKWQAQQEAGSRPLGADTPSAHVGSPAKAPPRAEPKTTSQEAAGGAAGDVAPDPKQPGQPKPNPLAAELAAKRAAQPPPPPVDTTDTLGTLRGLLESFMAEAHRNQAGNPRLATTLAKSAADVLDQIRKIEHAKREDSAVLRISRGDISKAHAAALERFKALCDRPLLCADCGRKLAIAWGEAGDKVAEALKGEGQ